LQAGNVGADKQQHQGYRAEECTQGGPGISGQVRKFGLDKSGAVLLVIVGKLTSEIAGNYAEISLCRFHGYAGPQPSNHSQHIESALLGCGAFALGVIGQRLP
jgi:hypothetical protein